MDGELAGKQARTQTERRDEAERRILNAGIRLLVEKGYDRFSLAEVGELAGYSRGLPGHYFGKKEDFLSQVAMFIVTSYRESAVDTSAFTPGLPRLTAKIQHYVQGFGTRPNRAMRVLLAEAPFRPGLRRTITELNQSVRERWQNEVKLGIAAGNIRADADPEAVGAIIHAFVRGQSTFVGLDPGYDVANVSAVFVESLERLLAPARK